MERRIKRGTLNIEFKGWQHIHEIEINDLVIHGGLVTGMAGICKSTDLNAFKHVLLQKEMNLHISCLRYAHQRIKRVKL